MGPVDGGGRRRRRLGRDVRRATGAPIPAGLSRLLRRARASTACCCSASTAPKATGWQTVEDMLPIVEHDPERFRIVANVNPHVHHPVARELDRQLDHGAVALKIHPVHAGIAPNDRELYPAYARCVERGHPGDRPHRAVVLPRGHVAARRPGAHRRRAARLPRPHRRARPRRPRLELRRGRVPRARPARTSGSTSPACRRSACPPTTRASASTGSPRSRSSAPTPRRRPRPATSPRSATSGSPTSSPTRCSARTPRRVFPGL